MVIPMRESEVAEASRFNRFISRTLTFSMMSSAAIGDWLAILIVLYGLGLEVQRVPGLFYLPSPSSPASPIMWMIQAIVTWLDQPGRFVVIRDADLPIDNERGNLPAGADSGLDEVLQSAAAYDLQRSRLQGSDLHRRLTVQCGDDAGMTCRLRRRVPRPYTSGTS
jgi:hypothetical protein